MTQPVRPVPGQPRPGQPRPGQPRPGQLPAPGTPGATADRRGLADQLGGLPVSAHAAVLQAEHERLQQLLATIDQW